MKSTSTPALSAQKIVALIQEGGMLSKAFRGFEPRVQQQEMLRNVIDAYNHNQISLIEAETGTGKSIAYLIPALLWAFHFHERTVISTNTIQLQEQLLQKDIPDLLKALNIQIKVALVKGMNNYLCLRKLEDAQSEVLFISAEEYAEIAEIEKWRKTTATGSRSELPFVPIPALWDRLGAEKEACPHHQCPHYQECYFFKARRQAQDAHLLIVNHHLLFADLMQRAETNNYDELSVLPPYKRVILDEAHHIEDIATEHFSARLSRLDFLRLLSKLSSDKQGANQGKLAILKEKIQNVFKTPSKDILEILNKLTIDLPALRHVLHEKIHSTFDDVVTFVDIVRTPSNNSNDQKLRIRSQHQEHPFWKEKIVPQANQLAEILQEYLNLLFHIEENCKGIVHDRLQEQTKGVRCDIQGGSIRIATATQLLRNFFSNTSVPSSKVRWIENQLLKSIVNVHLVDADLDISKALVDFLFSKFSTIILCSATLTTNRKFSFFRQQLGLNHPLLAHKKIVENIYGSPFDYKKQAMLAVPTDIPSPSDKDFQDVAFEHIWKAIQVSHGHAFVLFTSYAMLKSCYEALKDRFETNRYPLLKQGDDHRQKLVARFKTTKRAVLFGTDSFWEGVDIAGDALRCVIIVKLPFKVPGEPMIQARTEAILERGGDPFFEFSIPHAIVKFKQGFGRLIRNKWDRGSIICLDNRLVTKGYGRLFLDSLPDCEKVFMVGDLLWPYLGEFYQKTYHFVKNNPFS